MKRSNKMKYHLKWFIRIGIMKFGKTFYTHRVLFWDEKKNYARLSDVQLKCCQRDLTLHYNKNNTMLHIFIFKLIGMFLVMDGVGFISILNRNIHG